MSLDGFFFYTSQFLFKTWFTLNEYIPIKNYFNYFTNSGKKKSIGGTQHDSKIIINQVYYRPVNQHHLTNEKHLVYGVITEDNIKDVWKTIEEQGLSKSSEQKHRPNVGDMVEVHYTVPVETGNHHTHVSYCVSYVFPSNVHFPPYTLDEIKEYQQSDVYKNGILFAESGEDEITDDCVKWAGPMGNFYSDLPPRYGICVTRDLIVPRTSDKKFVITTNEVEEIEFQAGDILKLC